MKNLLCLFSLLASTCFTTAQSLCFDSASDFRYETNEYCTDIAVLDLDNDGNLDVITSSFGSPTCFFKGLGDGTFLPYQELAGTYGYDLELADINDDGYKDAARYDSGVINFLINDANGNLQNSYNYSIGSSINSPSEISLGHLNDDNLIDAIINDQSLDKVYAIINGGNGQFSHYEITVIDAPQNIKLSDLNGDGRDEVLVASSSQTNFAIYINNGGGAYDEILINIGDPMSGGSADIEVDDINNDGEPDILVAGLATMAYIQNNGANNFSFNSSVFMGSYSYGSITGDWNGDNMPDVAWANLSTGGVTIRLNSESGTWTSQGVAFYSSLGDSQELASGDFDNDGNLDLVVANGGSQHFAYLQGNGAGAFGPQTLLCGFGSEGLVVNDFDGDADLDIIATNNAGITNSFLALSRNNGDGSFAETEFLPSISNASEAATADLNLDGNADVILHSTQGFAFFAGNGNGTFQEVQFISSNNLGDGGERTIVLGDFNGDGILDLSGNRIAADNVNILYGLGNMQFTAPVTYTDGLSYARCIISAQLNDDNYDDLVVCSNSADQVYVYWGTANNSMTGPTIFNTPGAPEGLVSFDADEDGDNDLLIAAPNANKIYLLPSNNNQTFGPMANFNTPTGANANRMDAADINNDGHLDIACAFYQLDAVGVFFGNGDGTFQSAFSYQVDQNPNRLVCADFNADGAMDFSSLNSGIFNVSVVLNNSAFITYNGELAFCQGGSIELQASDGYSHLWSNGANSESITAMESGVYSCAITNQAGTCTLITPEVIVEVFEGQNVTLNLDSTYYCANTPAFFLTGGFPFGGQYTGQGVVAGSFNPSLAGPGIFEITYTYEDAGSCTNASAVATIEVDICDNVEEQWQEDLIVYPNPSNGIIYSNAKIPTSYQAVNIHGVIVASGAAQLGKAIDLAHLSAGIYTLNFTNKNERSILKLVKTE